jgi:hypothetical protein
MKPAGTITPFVEFLASADCETDDDLQALMDDIADKLGDMFGHQSARYELVERFIGRLQAAADAAGQEQRMAKN